MATTPPAPSPPKPEKTVNVSISTTREGKTDVRNYSKMRYATFTALQASCAAALAQLVAWGQRRVAYSLEGKPDTPAGGVEDLSFELDADHGPGTSNVRLGYTGLSKDSADEITAVLMSAVDMVVGKP